MTPATKRTRSLVEWKSGLAVILATAFALALLTCQAAVAAEEPAASDDDNPHLWKPRTRSVAVFKNGLGFFMREGEVELRDGWCAAQRIPPAAFGTLAIFAHDEKEIVDVVGAGPGEVVEFDGLDTPKDPETKRARLEASKNLKVELTYTYKGQDRTAAGTLISVGPEFVVLDSGSNSFAVPLDGVAKMQILEMPLRIHVASEADQPPEKSTLGMAYLRKGITWIPEYTLEIIDETTAELSLRGTLVNEAEDLIHTDVHLVVGVPHFVHTDYMAPIAVGQVIRTIGAAVAPQAVMNQIANRSAMVSNGITAPQFDLPAGVVEQSVPTDGGDLSSALGNLPQLGGAAATDYTVYTKEDLTLRLGEKAIITLFKRKITYSHIYRWSPPARMEHLLVLHNNTDTAWTTGPCLALSDDRPLSEDLLKYTPKGGNSELPVTAAINVAHEKIEREIDRKFKAHTPDDHVYLDLVTLEGKLLLRNYEKRSVTIVVENPIPGKPTEVTEKGSISVDPTQLQLLQRAGSIRWTVTLEPGEERTLVYQYERYVKSY
ncbi:MAG TPA: hypothetical protein VMY42_27280 [Thermoguttaceae bacterium]|nr:hypothetical protein [Thermoguttaceae bacterium]